MTGTESMGARVMMRYPYARVKAMRELLEFIREANWNPDKLDRSLLRKLAIAPSKQYEAISALRFLGLIDHDGRPTKSFFKLKDEYKRTLEGLVRSSYWELFELIPPSLMTQERLLNFFETARDTAEYQAKLFVYLCQESEIDLPNVSIKFHRSRHDK